MWTKLATPAPTKITILINKCYDVVISLDEVTNKILSLDSNHVVDVVI